MADETKPDETKPPEAPTPDGDPTEEELAALGDAGKRALERVRKERDDAKAAATAAAEKARLYDEQQEANLTEQQRREKQAAEAETRAEKAERRANQIEAAVSAGLPVTWAARLVGNTPEELAADAKALAEDRASVATTATRTRRTTGDGNTSGEGPGKGGMSRLLRQKAGRPE